MRGRLKGTLGYVMMARPLAVLSLNRSIWEKETAP
jgi:hypothetical protein